MKLFLIQESYVVQVLSTVKRCLEPDAHDLQCLFFRDHPHWTSSLMLYYFSPFFLSSSISFAPTLVLLRPIFFALGCSFDLGCSRARPSISNSSAEATRCKRCKLARA